MRLVANGHDLHCELAAQHVIEPQTAAKPKRPRKASGDKPKKVKRADRVMELIQRAIGVSLPELQGEFGILPHTARAYISVVTRARGVKAVLRDGRYYLSPR